MFTLKYVPNFKLYYDQRDMVCHDVTYGRSQIFSTLELLLLPVGTYTHMPLWTDKVMCCQHLQRDKRPSHMNYNIHTPPQGPSLTGRPVQKMCY